MMKITLNVNGQEKTFSEQELVDIFEKFYQNKISTDREKATEILVKVPTEGEWFDVNPQEIDKSLFQKERIDGKQELTRLLILDAFNEVSSKPEKYGRSFKTIMPKKKWISKKVTDMNHYAEKLGDHMADWVEQCLEWAQRISNGESWEKICNNPDTANWYRLVIWKDGYARLIGSSRLYSNFFPATNVSEFVCISCSKLYFAVPLVVRK